MPNKTTKISSYKHFTQPNVLVFKVSKTFFNVTATRDLPAGNYLFKVNNRNTRTRCEICLKLTIMTAERREWHCSGIFIVNSEHIHTLF